VKVYFTQATAISEGARVQVAGQQVGTLASIAMVRADQCGPEHPLAGTGGLVATLSLEPGWANRIPINSEFFIAARSVFAPRYVEIGAPPGKALPGRPVREGDEVRGIDPPNLDRLLQRTWENLTDVKEFMDGIKPFTVKITVSAVQLALTIDSLEPAPGTFAAIDEEVDAAAREARAVVEKALDGTIDLDEARAIFLRVRALVGRVELLAADLAGRVDVLRAAVAKAGAQIPADASAALDRALIDGQAAMRGASELLGQLRAVMDDLAWGKGTIGAFISDDELFDEFKDMIKLIKRNPWTVLPPSE
jgi:ABC-type transporter Mla subunit MlaD